MSSEEIRTPIVICSRTAWKWLDKLGYRYKNMCKDMFVNRDEQANVVKDCKNFFKKLEELKL